MRACRHAGFAAMAAFLLCGIGNGAAQNGQTLGGSAPAGLNSSGTNLGGSAPTGLNSSGGALGGAAPRGLNPNNARAPGIDAFTTPEPQGRPSAGLPRTVEPAAASPVRLPPRRAGKRQRPRR